MMTERHRSNYDLIDLIEALSTPHNWSITLINFCSSSIMAVKSCLNKAIDFMGFNGYCPRPNYVQGENDNFILI